MRNSFILGLDTPKVLKALMLSYLTVNDLKKIQDTKTTDVDLNGLQSIILNQFHLWSAIDLEQLAPMISIQLPNPNLAEQLALFIQSFFTNILLYEELFARALVHLQHLDSKKSASLFIQASENPAVSNTLIKLMLEYIPVTPTFSQKNIGTRIYRTEYPISKSEAYETGAWGGYDLKDDVSYDREEDNYYRIEERDENIIVLHGGILVELLIRADKALTTIILKYYFYVPGLIETLTEIYDLCLSAENSPHTYQINYSIEQVKKAFLVLIEALTERSNEQTKLLFASISRSEIREVLIHAIAQNNFEKINGLAKVVQWYKYYCDEFHANHQQYWPKLKSLILAELTTSTPNYPCINEILGYVNDNVFYQDLLEKAIINQDLQLTIILHNKSVILPLTQQYYSFTRPIIREDIKTIAANIEAMSTKAQTPEEIKTIRFYQQKTQPLFLQYTDKETLNNAFIANLKLFYIAAATGNQGFKVFYTPFGGILTWIAELQKIDYVPDGIQRIFKVRDQKGYSATEKFDNYHTILREKKTDLLKCCLWKTRRDPKLETFYERWADTFSVTANKYT